MTTDSNRDSDDLRGYDYYHPVDVLRFYLGKLVDRCNKRRFWDPPPGGRALSIEEDEAIYGPIDSTEDQRLWSWRWRRSVDDCKGAIGSVVGINRWLRYGLGERAGRLETELRTQLPEFLSILNQVREPTHFSDHLEEFIARLSKLTRLSNELGTVALDPNDGALEEWFTYLETMRLYLSELLTFHTVLVKVVSCKPPGRIGNSLYRYMVAACNFEEVLRLVEAQIRRGGDDEYCQVLEIPWLCAQARWSFVGELTNNRLPEGSFPCDIHQRLRRVVTHIIHEIAATLANRPGADQPLALWSAWLIGDTPSSRPTWDKELRELRFGGILCKKFRKAAPNQELLLQAFQEEHWSHRIDNPLRGSKLSETMRQLNKTTKLIRFRADGSGEGVLWELSNSPR